MNVEKKQVFVTKIEEDLANGMSWLKRDDAGYGSIQEKYNATDVHIATIRKHPLLKNLEPSLVIFEVIDDTNERDTTNPVVEQTHEDSMECIPEPSITKSRPSTRLSTISDRTVEERVQQDTQLVGTDSADAFFNI